MLTEKLKNYQKKKKKKETLSETLKMEVDISDAIKSVRDLTHQ